MSYDVAIVGAGHNSLVAAAYLARAGRSVVVLERRPVAGGSATTEELAPGFRVPAAFASAETFAPSIVAELDLTSHGLELLPTGGVLVPRSDGQPLFLAPPAGGDGPPGVDGISAADAEALAELDGFLRRIAGAIAPILEAPLPDLEPSGLPGIFDLLRPAFRLRRLGASDLAAAMRFLPMPVADVVDERLEDPALMAAVAAGGILGSWLGPRSPGSAMNLLLHRCGGCRGAVGFPRFVRGGPGGLSEALAAAARTAGAEIRTEAEVETVLVSKGAAKGVALTGGEEIAAGVVASGADPKTTFLELVDPGHLEPSFLLAVRNLRSRGTVAIAWFALDRLPEFSGIDDSRQLAGRIQIGATPDDLERAFDDAKYGRLPQRPFLDLTIPSLADPGLAPEGKHVLHAWVQYPPYDLRERSWDEARDELGAIVEKSIAEVAPGFSDSILERRVLTPADLEERFGVTGGCLYHLEPALDQELYMRPLPRWARHTTPIDGLYLCGAGAHGGGGLTGLAGRNAARVMLSSVQ